MTIRVDDNLSSTFHILQNKYQKNIRISDFYVIFLIPDYHIVYTSDRSNRLYTNFHKKTVLFDYYHPISLLEGKYGTI